MKTNIRKVKEIKEIYRIIEEDIVSQMKKGRHEFEEELGILKGLRIALGEDYRQ